MPRTPWRQAKRLGLLLLMFLFSGRDAGAEVSILFRVQGMLLFMGLGLPEGKFSRFQAQVGLLVGWVWLKRSEISSGAQGAWSLINFGTGSVVKQKRMR